MIAIPNGYLRGVSSGQIKLLLSGIILIPAQIVLYTDLILKAVFLVISVNSIIMLYSLALL